MSWRRELAAARWVRRVSVPAWMITAAARRRLAGDWRGACAAALVDVEVDLPAITRADGAGTAARVEDDLRHLVPDLLRWHLDPAAPGTVLSEPAAGRALWVQRRGPGRLALRYGPPPDLSRWSLRYSREQWDSRHTGSLGERGAGAGSRVPFLDAGGARLPEARWGLTEHVIALQDAGDWAGAWRLAGLDGAGAVPARGVWRLDLTGGMVGPGTAGRALPAPLVERPADVDLVRLGMLPASALHPLVGAALFPGLRSMPPSPVPGTGPVRVRRDGAWQLADPADLGWHDPLAALPKALRLRRAVLVRLAQHGDAPALSAWLAAGGDPWLRDPARRTLLHLAAALPGGPDRDVEELLLDLLAAGLDLEARDGAGHTPLLYAVANGGTVTAVRTLVTMGADVRAVTFAGAGCLELAQAAGRPPEPALLSALR
ncbi:ankyrin repeat domain-containing protein [Dactylosporangium sp. NPDC050688]|uniref:ankyrin repeat domain-containing protein n=1 Tax=Dactylosporangium sp. NPDC050688 TaxID=3157217 RepID=UPI0033F2C86A